MRTGNWVRSLEYGPRDLWQDPDTQSTQTPPVTGQPFEPSLRLQGQYEGMDTGRYQNLHRYYDPHSGRYVSRDPIGLLGGPKAYQYCQDPVEWIDPLGLASKECDKNRKTFYQGASRRDAFRQAE